MTTSLWPIWGDVACEYAHYCRHVAGLIDRHAGRPAGTLLDIGCGGGKNVFNLKETFSVTGVDLSPTMLTQARDLNRESTFVLGNIRTFQLGTTFDVVFVENVYDTDPADEQYGTTVLFLIRDHGRLRIETDHWTMGIFSPDTWRRVLRDTGFEVHEG